MFRRALLLVCLMLLLFAVPAHAWYNEIPKSLRGILLYAPDPEYPQPVANAGWGGKGNYRLIIDTKTGRVTEVKVLRTMPHALLNDLVAKALLQWRFRPGTLGSLEVPFEFSVGGYTRTVH